jgi:gamma-glutamyltranspeptidase/glutathione hydrolase
MLRREGSAVDAAIAAQLVLTLVEPQSSGIGGGLFLLVADAKGHMRVFDGRETAPASAHGEMYLQKNGQPRALEDIATGGFSVGVPGAIAALELAHRRYGKLPWRELFGPAIRLSESGFPVSPLLAQAIAELKFDRLSPEMQAAYFHKDGSPFRAGEPLRDLELAKTLRKIAEGGSSVFYEGEIAQAIVASVQKASHNPGGMTLDDMRGYKAHERSPLCLQFQLHNVCTTPTPSGGASLLQILGMLGDRSPESLRLGTLSQIHLVSQAERLAYADRAKWMADPAYALVPVEGLLDAGYLKSRAALINASSDMGRAEAGTPPKRDANAIDYAPHRTNTLHGTSHVAIADPSGQVVSMTSSVQAAFGAQIRAAGFVLNNELTDFSREPRFQGKPVANAPDAGKRPLSAMSPTIVFDPQGKFFASVGSPGGPEIITYNAQALINIIAGKATLRAAMSAPHFANLNGPTILEKSTRIIAMAPLLFLKGHSVRFRELPSGLNGITKTPTGYEAATDVRGEGLAAGE